MAIAALAVTWFAITKVTGVGEGTDDSEETEISSEESEVSPAGEDGQNDGSASQQGQEDSSMDPGGENQQDSDISGQDGPTSDNPDMRGPGSPTDENQDPVGQEIVDPAPGHATGAQAIAGYLNASYDSRSGEEAAKYVMPNKEGWDPASIQSAIDVINADVKHSAVMVRNPDNSYSVKLTLSNPATSSVWVYNQLYTVDKTEDGRFLISGKQELGEAEQ